MLESISYPVYETIDEETLDPCNGKLLQLKQSETESSLNDSTTSKTINGIAGTKYTPVHHPFIPVWTKIYLTILFHLLAFYGVFQLHYIKLATFLWLVVLTLANPIGTLAGAHRLWSHRSFKATFALRLLMAACQSCGFTVSIYDWARDHRGHHKWSDTDADPYNAGRGFFYSHIGWFMHRKHPEVIRKGKTLDVSDLEADSIVMFQHRYYYWTVLVFWGVLPAAIPVYFWDESVWLAVVTCVFVRYIYSLHTLLLINSWAHMFGYRPYDKRIAPTEASYIRHVLNGEGFHNFHHAFPWDYSNSELGSLKVFNPATAFIDICHWLGLVWDLKVASPSLVERKSAVHGEPDSPYQRNSPIREWFSGILTFLGPWFAVRWLLMAFW